MASQDQEIEETGSPEADQRRPFRRRLLEFLLLAVVLTAGFLVLDIDRLVRSVGDSINALGPLGGVVFVAVHTLAVVILVPGAVFPLMAGYLFGPLLGTGLSATGKTLGALIAFSIARFLIGGHRQSKWLDRIRQRSRKFSLLERGLVEGGWKSVAMIRLIPAIPFKLSNYLLGWSKVKASDFLVGTFFGTIPFSVTTAYLGSLAGGLSGLGKAPLPRTTMGTILYCAAALIALGAALAAILRARRILRDAESTTD